MRTLLPSLPLSLALAGASACAVLVGCPGGERAASGGDPRSLEIKGSDTMVHLVTAWAEAFMKANPGETISVTGGGSGTGIAAVINGTTDLAMSSRAMKPRELALAEERGFSPQKNVVALDGLAVMVHPDNPIDALAMDQLRQVYNGTLTHWRELGGPDRPIQALSRASNSGTYVYFNEFVLQKDDFAPAVRLMPSTAAIVQSVAQDAWSIGYGGIAYAEGGAVKIVPIKADPGAPAVPPSVAAVQDGSYPIARPMHLYTQKEPSDLARRFLAFVRSEAGQAIVLEIGYVPMTSDGPTK